MPAIQMNTGLWNKFKKFKSKYKVILCVFIFIQIKSKDKTVKMIVNKDDCRKKNALKSDEEKSKKINENL